MGKEMYENNDLVRLLFDIVNEMFGFVIIDVMFFGISEDLK